MRWSLGQYEFTHELGRGGMGVVWAAYDREHRREVAVKLLAPRGHGSDHTTLERRFRREASLTSRLTHPGIPVVYEHGGSGDELYLVMEFVPGRALDAVLQEEGPLPVGRAAGIARGAADALSCAHGEGVVHRDLKPSNLMITSSGEVKVLDFGVAAALEPAPGETRLTAANVTPGTVVYMAPEQAVGQAAPASDLYALGCVLYELLTGKPPFTDAGPFMLYHRHAHDPVPPLSGHRPDIPADLEALILRLLEKKPEDRPASAAELSDLLATWAPAPTDAAPAPSAPPGGPAPVTSVHAELAELAALRRDAHPARALHGYTELLAQAGLDPADVLAARYGSALCAGALGRTREALDELMSVLAEQRSLLGDSDPSVLDTRYEIGVLLVGSGEHHRAEELLRRAAEGEAAYLAPGDSRHGRSRALLDRLGRPA